MHVTGIVGILWIDQFKTHLRSRSITAARGCPPAYDIKSVAARNSEAVPDPDRTRSSVLRALGRCPRSGAGREAAVGPAEQACPLHGDL